MVPVDVPSREKFLNDVLEIIAGKFPLVKVSRGEERFSLRINGQTASLENVYRIAAFRPEDSSKHVERWIVELLRAAEGTPDAHDPFDSVRSRIMPMIAPDPGDIAALGVTQPLTQGLAVAYAVDQDRSVSYVTPQRLSQWGVSQDELHAAALENLLRRSEELDAHAAQDEQGNIYLILFQTMDGFDASRLLLPNLHEKLRGHLGTPFAAAIPNRDILLCFRNEDSAIAKLLPQIKSDFERMPHQLTDQLLLVTADGIASRD
ncbi:MAG: DUF1444 family protein [Tepidisphaeraceae bacterium]|jgi:hypothetical protein